MFVLIGHRISRQAVIHWVYVSILKVLYFVLGYLLFIYYDYYSLFNIICFIIIIMLIFFMLLYIIIICFFYRYIFLFSLQGRPGDNQLSFTPVHTLWRWFGRLWCFLKFL